MDPQRTARQRASERAQRVEDAVAGAVDRDAYPIRAEDLASEYGSAELPGVDLETALDAVTDDEFDSPTEVRQAVQDALVREPDPADVATFDADEGT